MTTRSGKLHLLTHYSLFDWGETDRYGFNRFTNCSATLLAPAEPENAPAPTATLRPGWLVAHCAAVLAASTTMRGVELKGLRWQDVDLFARTLTVMRSKTEAGHRPYLSMMTRWRR